AAADRGSPQKSQHIAFLSEMEEEEEVIPTPVSLISQDGTEQVGLSGEDLQALGSRMGVVTQSSALPVEPVGSDNLAVPNGTQTQPVTIVTSGAVPSEESGIASLCHQQVALLATSKGTPLTVQLAERQGLEGALSTATAAIQQDPVTRSFLGTSQHLEQSPPSTETSQHLSGAELGLDSIWCAVPALDVEKSGKVSKSQLKVLSHNLYTVLCIPHDPVALEEHFRDDDDGPVSSQGYMPYLNKYILDKVEEGAFVKEDFDELCWTLTAKKNYKPDRNGNSVVSHQDAFKLWCLFNFLSEDKYPLVMVPDEVEYLLKKICTAMNVELNSCELDDYLSQEPQGQGGLTVWQFLDMVNSGRFLRGIEQEAVSMAVEEVYQEIIEDVLKQGYLWKKGQLRRNWSERWFTLKPSALSYYMSEERKEKKGSIALDKHCCVE
ncbi:PREDICTED: differentially expressed in FDCP 6 homolog, partial [Merops nubicus]|uniref:differentially expressed in FDCP 6 homolog n=1 Tax=Merops nubicus TaxID=57421 RepID=UPI0004F02E09